MKEMLRAAFVADEAKAFVDKESGDCPGRHTRSPPLTPPRGHPKGFQPAADIGLREPDETQRRLSRFKLSVELENRASLGAFSDGSQAKVPGCSTGDAMSPIQFGPMIPAVVLAAGLSTRMGGQPKALLRVTDGRTFVGAIVDTFRHAGIDDVVVVLGHEADAVIEQMERDDVRARVVVNRHYRSGQYSSVLAGLDAIDRPGVAAMLMTLVDVPLVSASTVRAVVERFRRLSPPIVRPVRGEEHGHPVLIARGLFAALRAADPAQGAKPMVRAHVSFDGDVEVDDDQAFRDVDTPDAYARILTG